MGALYHVAPIMQHAFASRLLISENHLQNPTLQVVTETTLRVSTDPFIEAGGEGCSSPPGGAQHLAVLGPKYPLATVPD